MSAGGERVGGEFLDSGVAPEAWLTTDLLTQQTMLSQGKLWIT
jgi:hypothetical protein